MSSQLNLNILPLHFCVICFYVLCVERCGPQNREQSRLLGFFVLFVTVNYFLLSQLDI